MLVETAPSFEEMSRSITGLLTDCVADEAAAGEAYDEAFSTTATLSAEYQQMSTWCWVNLRVCCDVLLYWVADKKVEHACLLNRDFGSD